MIEVPTADGVADAYLTGDGPSVLFCIDAFGLRPQIEAMADRIAERGFRVLAPNLFYRSGRAPILEMPDLSDPDNRAAFFAQIKPLAAQLTPEAILSDARAYLDFLGAPVAITGYCMGARFGMRIAAVYPDDVVALGGFHGGGLVTEADDSPHRSAGDITAEVYFGHADGDFTADQLATLDAAFAGRPYRAEVYAGAAHGYTMADTAAYDEAAAERHFTELFALLDRTLQAA